MEIKIKFSDEKVETHHLPELAGNTTSLFDERAKMEKGFNDVDTVVDVIERFSREQAGFVLSRYVIVQNGKELEKLRSSHYTVLPASRMAEAERVFVDDEQVWQNPACGNSDEGDLGIGW